MRSLTFYICIVISLWLLTVEKQSDRNYTPLFFQCKWIKQRNPLR